MTDLALHPVPRARDVLAEQVRIVGLSIRREAAAIAALLALATVLIVYGIVADATAVRFRPEDQLAPAAIGFLLPLLVWRREGLFEGSSHLWFLPVDRRRHVLLKALAGWTWLMVVVAAFLLWLLSIALLTGGAIGGEEMRTLLVAQPADGPPVLRTDVWDPPLWGWMLPFAGATLTYLFGSALVLATGHPWRWMAGVIVVLLALGALGELGNVGWLAGIAETVAETVFAAPGGLDTVLTAGTETAKTELRLPSGERIVVWRTAADPDLGRWAAVTALWLAAALTFLWAAASRHRER